MYYPYLRARQFELIALRELAMEEATQDVIIPILEPIKEMFNNLNLAHRVFFEKNQKAYLILNPSIGELTGDDDYFVKVLSELNSNVFLPAFHYNDNANYINNCIDRYNLDDCMILCQNDNSGYDPYFSEIVHREEVTKINVADPSKNRELHRFLKGLNKTYIRLDDLFEKRQRNSDYLNIEKHRFSEEHLFYKEEGFSGFSDYTVLPSEYIEGGSTPRAVVIHLTYLNGQNQIWIRHFTSETNDSISNVQGKFAEAAQKVLHYCDSKGISNSAISELRNYFDKEHYPGLGTVKKISIKNHLLVLSTFLRKS